MFSPIAQTFHPHLHFTLNLTFPYPFSLYSASSSPPSSSSYDDTDAKHNDKHRGGTVPRCNLQLNLHLPDSIFLDPSELPDHFAAQPNILSWKIEPGEVDIERPEIYARSSDTGEGGRAEAEEGVKRAGEREGEGAGAGSEFWLMLTKSDSETSNGQVEVKIPVHGRYLTPDESGYRRITLFESGIRGGWVCTPGLDSSPSTTCSSSPSDNSPFWIRKSSLYPLSSSVRGPDVIPHPDLNAKTKLIKQNSNRLTPHIDLFPLNPHTNTPNRTSISSITSRGNYGRIDLVGVLLSHLEDLEVGAKG